MSKKLISLVLAVAVALAVVAVLRLPSARSRPAAVAPLRPLAYTPDRPVFVNDGRGQYDGTANRASLGAVHGYFTSGYWIDVPRSYRSGTPETLLVWLHSCDSSAADDITHLTSEYTSDRPWIMIAPSGPEGGSRQPNCWNTHSAGQVDVAKVLADIRGVEARLDINRRRVIIAGYSSGGDLAYQTIFQHADTFAGILAFNTNPVSDNSFTAQFGPAAALRHAVADAAWRFPIVQVSHSSDDLYHVNRCGYPDDPACPTGDPSGVTNPDPGVRPVIDALHHDGFPTRLIVLPGPHYEVERPAGCDGDAPGYVCRSGSYYDIVHVLLSRIATDHWSSPAP